MGKRLGMALMVGGVVVAVVAVGLMPRKPALVDTPTVEQKRVSFDMGLARRAGIGWDSLKPCTESEAASGWQELRARPDPWAKVSTTEIIHRIEATSPANPGIDRFINLVNWEREATPSQEKRYEVILVPQIHQAGKVDAHGGRAPDQLAVKAQQEIGQFLLNRAQHGRFGLLVEGLPFRGLFGVADIEKMVQFFHLDGWDENMLAFNGALLFGLTKPECPMMTEGAVSGHMMLWTGLKPETWQQQANYEPINRLRDRVMAAQATRLTDQAHLPVYVVMGTLHIPGIQYQLKSWGVPCHRVWVPPTVQTVTIK